MDKAGKGRVSSFESFQKTPQSIIPEELRKQYSDSFRPAINSWKKLFLCFRKKSGK